MMRVFAELTAAQIDAGRAAGRRRTEAAARVRSAMAGEGLSMVYQPMVEADRRRPVGFEAPARFSARPPRPPDAWFAEAGEAGLGVELELAAVALALRGRPRVAPDAYLALDVSPATAGELRTLRDLGATVAKGNFLGHPGARLSRSGVLGGG